MKIVKVVLTAVATLALLAPAPGTAAPRSGKIKILVVSSYHREYRWSQETNKGFCAAMVKFGYFDNEAQATAYSTVDAVESSKAIVMKLWMDAKRKNSKGDLEAASLAIMRRAREFKPDIILLGDDDAANYIGKRYLDTDIPVVFWGVNNSPVKYGLVDTAERPGHNVTGVYQSAYYIESLELLKVLKPAAKTFIVLSDDTVTGRSNSKEIEYLDRKGLLPIKLTGVIATSNFDTWKSKVLEYQKKADAFLVATIAAMKDSTGSYVPLEEVAKWYQEHVAIPEAATLRQYVEQGVLCGADDSAYNQGYEAVVIANDILARGAIPATYPARAPKRGALMVNTARARALGIALTEAMGIEEYIGSNEK